jgi:hypothetical protein
VLKVGILLLNQIKDFCILKPYKLLYSLYGIVAYVLMTVVIMIGIGIFVMMDNEVEIMIL